MACAESTIVMVLVALFAAVNVVTASVHRTWVYPVSASQVVPHGRLLYVLGLATSTNSTESVFVLNRHNGTLVSNLPFAPPSTMTDYFHRSGLVVLPDGDVLLRRFHHIEFTTATTLLRYNVSSDVVVWQLPTDTSNVVPQVAVGALLGDLVYQAVGNEVHVVNVTNGTLMHSLSVPWPSQTNRLDFIDLHVAQPAGTAGWLVLHYPSGHVQGYTLVEPTRPVLAWNATDESTGALVTMPSLTLSPAGDQIVGWKVNGDTSWPWYPPPVTTIATIDPATGVARQTQVSGQLAIGGATKYLAVMTVLSQSLSTSEIQVVTFNLTSMTFVGPFVQSEGYALCAVATDSSAFVCARGIGVVAFTVFSARHGKVIAEFSAPTVIPPSITATDTAGTIQVIRAPSLRGAQAYDVYFVGDGLEMIELPPVDK